MHAFARTAILLSALGAILSIGYFLIQRPANDNSLRFGAQAHGLLLGAAVAIKPLKNDVTYANMYHDDNAHRRASEYPSQPAQFVSRLIQ